MPPRSTILFVDDEPSILTGMQLLLRKERKRWRVLVANNGGEALRILEAERVDILVCDLRMPVMDGIEVLTQVRDAWPATQRIVLSAQAGRGTMLRSVGLAHQHLSKPCPSEQLHAALERACDATQRLEAPRLRELIGGLSHLPSVPQVYLDITAALADPDRDLDDIAELVEHDAALTARVLQLVNSAYFGLPRKVNDVRQAARFLGVELLRSLVLGLEVFKGEALGLPGFSIQALQDRSLRAAVAARAIAKTAPDCDEAFASALMSEIGTLVLAQSATDDYRSVLEHASREQLPLHLAEHDLLGTTHADIGAYLLELWGLPKGIVEGVASHHRPESVAPGSVSGAAACLAHGWVEGVQDPDEPEVRQKLLERVGLEDRADDIAEILEALQREAPP